MRFVETVTIMSLVSPRVLRIGYVVTAVNKIGLYGEEGRQGRNLCAQHLLQHNHFKWSAELGPGSHSLFLVFSLVFRVKIVMSSGPPYCVFIEHE